MVGAGADAKVWIRLHQFTMIPVFPSLVPTLIKGYLKNKYFKINEIFLVRILGRRNVV